MSAPLSLVAVVGRPNVGKSTFFNRVTGGGGAVVDDLPGVTRDRREGVASWLDARFRIMDTGGLVPGTRDAMESKILAQAQAALDGADLVLFLVDAREGITGLDRDIAEGLRGHAEKVILAANKAEGTAQEIAAMEASSLGFGSPWIISAEHGKGVGDLLDEIVRRLPHHDAGENHDDAIRLALVGRPNVGKSSIANRLLGEERLIVHHEAGTTRDAIDVPFRFDERDFILVDTAGLRRRTHVEKGVEFYSTLRTRRSLERAHVAVLVLDATEPLTAQDARITSLIREAGKSAVFVYNKWDLVAKETGTTESFTRALRKKFPHFAQAPVLFVSALTGLRVQRIPPTARDLFEERRRRIGTSELNDLLKTATERRQPPIGRNGRPLRFYYVTQTADSPPTFTVFANYPEDMPASYRTYLENLFRNRLGFRATPVRLSFRARKRA